MVFINEWLPNPVGPDTAGEFIELFNNGPTPVDLAGWKLQADKKVFLLDGHSIPAGGYLLLKRGETKLVLKNNDAAVYLYDPAGTLADRSAFQGTAIEGESFSRVNDNMNIHMQHFAWSEPTPGAMNKVNINLSISNDQYPFNIPINSPSLNFFNILALSLALAVILAGVMLYAIKKHENLSDLFFGRNAEIR